RRQPRGVAPVRRHAPPREMAGAGCAGRGRAGAVDPLAWGPAPQAPRQSRQYAFLINQLGNLHCRGTMPRMALSVFDLFKIGIGPSSSHTVGPMRAARQFALRLRDRGLLAQVARLGVTLYGSLGATGKGHGSDKAILLGLCGHEPDTIDVDAIAGIVGNIRSSGRLALLGEREIAFDERADLVFNHKDTLPLHSNGMRFAAFDGGGAELVNGTYYS